MSDRSNIKHAEHEFQYYLYFNKNVISLDKKKKSRNIHLLGATNFLLQKGNILAELPLSDTPSSPISAFVINEWSLGRDSNE